MAAASLPLGFGYEVSSEESESSEDVDTTALLLAFERKKLRRYDKYIHEIRDHFNSQCLFKYEGVAGIGAYGLACRVIQRRNRRTRRIIVKRSLDDDDAGELENEIWTMERLNGSAHIASVIAAHDDSSPPRRRFIRVLKQLAARIQRKQHAMLIGLRGPALVMEYLENGELDRLYQRARTHGQILPNRILWSFFFCLVRACVAMAFPPNQAPDTATQLEMIPTDETAFGGIRHGDMHLGNILVGTAKDFPEHAIVPPLKLIDFGLATQTDSAVQDNLSAITKVMMKLITNDAVTVQSELRLYNGVMTMAAEILPGAGNHYPTLDPDLRDLVARCLATDAADRPDLATMLQVTQDAVTNKDAASFSPNDFLETDEEIQRVLQIILYDAD